MSKNWKDWKTQALRVDHQRHTHQRGIQTIRNDQDLWNKVNKACHKSGYSSTPPGAAAGSMVTLRASGSPGSQGVNVRCRVMGKSHVGKESKESQIITWESRNLHCQVGLSGGKLWDARSGCLHVPSLSYPSAFHLGVWSSSWSEGVLAQQITISGHSCAHGNSHSRSHLRSRPWAPHQSPTFFEPQGGGHEKCPWSPGLYRMFPSRVQHLMTTPHCVDWGAIRSEAAAGQKRCWRRRRNISNSEILWTNRTWKSRTSLGHDLLWKRKDLHIATTMAARGLQKRMKWRAPAAPLPYTPAFLCSE